MFRLTEPSSDQIQNTVPVHSVSAHYGIHIVYRIVLTLKIMYWLTYLNEYIKIHVFKKYIKAYQYDFVEIMLDYICTISNNNNNNTNVKIMLDYICIIVVIIHMSKLC